MFDWEKLREQAVVAAFQVLLQHENQKADNERKIGDRHRGSRH